MENYYSKVGRLLSRREALKALSAASAAMLAGWLPRQSGAGQPMGAPVQAISAANKGTLASCIVRPQVTEGPYYVNEDLNRSDIRADPATGAVKDGALLILTCRVSQVSNGSCTPLAGAKVEIWHCEQGVFIRTCRTPGSIPWARSSCVAIR